jgi:hypothetical protein
METTDKQTTKKDDIHPIKKWIREHPVGIVFAILSLAIVLFYTIFILIGMYVHH